MFRVGLSHLTRRVLAVASLAVLAACSEQQPTEPPNPTSSDLLFGSSGPRLVECSTDETLKAVANVVPWEATTLSLGGASVLFPLGAVTEPTTVELTIPASKYVEIRLRANGQEHYEGFLQPLTVTISYSRCNRTDVLYKPLSAWYIDAETKALLTPMIGVDNKLTRSVTFVTDHFSGYAIAF